MLFTWWRELLRKSTTRTIRRGQRNGFRPAFDRLEDRVVPAFLAPVSTPAGMTVNDMATGDFNGDGIADLVSVGSISGRGVISVNLGNGDGTFQAPKLCNSGNTDPLQVRVADFNGDGKNDVAILGSYYVDSLTICNGNGDGTFQLPTPYTYSIPPTEIEVGDMNHDGHPDLIEGNHFFDTVSVQLNDGRGHFGPKIDSGGVITPSAVKAADFNGDGKNDIVSTSVYYNFGNGVNVQLGNGDGTLQAPKTYLTGGTAIDVLTGDFNGDGKRDIAVANTNNTIGVLIGNGDGTFKPAAVYNVGTSVLDIRKADFNGDGITDLVEQTGTGFAVELGNIDGSFQPASLINAGTGSDLVAADFNGDGVSDVAIANLGTINTSLNDSTPIINQNNNAATFVVAAPATTFAGAANSVTVTAVDASGNPITNFAGVVHLASNDPQGDSMTSYLFSAADGGTHTFTGFSLFTAGTQTIVASSPAGATASQSITVTPSAATHLAITTPATTAAGTPMTFTVVALDTWNNAGASYTGTVHFSSSDAQSTLPADYTFVPSDAGNHAFTATLDTAAPAGETIAATDTATPSVTGTSAAITVTPSTAVALGLGGGGGFVGAPHAVTVTARDAFDNTDPTYTGTVHLTSSDAAATVSGDVTLVNGVGTITVTPMTVGTETLSAVDTANAAIAGSEAVVVTPGWASRFVVAAPVTAVAGVSQNVTVTAYDSFGNVSTVYTGSVALSSGLTTALPPAYTFTAADAGRHAFSVTFQVASSLNRLTATDLASSAITGTQSGIVVTAGAATHFTFTYLAPLVVTFPPQPQFTAGQQQIFDLIAQDAFGNNADANFSGTLNLKSSDAQAVLPATFNFVAGANNRVPVTFKTAGTDTLTATSASNAAITGTSSFTVGAAATATFSITGADGAAGVLHSATVTARDAFGNFTAGYGGTVHFTSSDTKAVLPADTALVNGTVTVGVRMMTVGSQTLTATDTTNAALTGTSPVSVTAALLGGLDVTGFPSTTAGAAHTFTITARDTVGQMMADYVGTVVFSSSDVQAGLPASYTFTAADKGSHVFTATLKTAGTQSIFARDSVTPAINGAQTGIAVTAAAATSLSLTGFPASTVAGVASNFTVTVRDAYGNLATGYTGTVAFTSTDAKAALPANYRFTSADGGVHVFSATFKTAAGSQNVGGQTLTVKDTGNVALVSSETNIQVANAAMSTFAIVAPSKITVGTPFTLKVIAEDAFGNEVSNYFGTIAFTTSAGIVGLPTNYTFTAADNGQHSFTVTLTSSTAQTVSLIDVANASFSATATLTTGTATGGGGGGGGTGGGGGGGGGSGGGGGTA